MARKVFQSFEKLRAAVVTYHELVKQFELVRAKAHYATNLAMLLDMRSAAIHTQEAAIELVGQLTELNADLNEAIDNLVDQS